VALHLVQQAGSAQPAIQTPQAVGLMGKGRDQLSVDALPELDNP